MVATDDLQSRRRERCVAVIFEIGIIRAIMLSKLIKIAALGLGAVIFLPLYRVC